jgi:hypothetical protein
MGIAWRLAVNTSFTARFHTFGPSPKLYGCIRFRPCHALLRTIPCLPSSPHVVHHMLCTPSKRLCTGLSCRGSTAPVLVALASLQPLALLTACTISSTEANTHTKLAKATSSVTCQESISKDAILPLCKLRGTCRSDLAFVLHHMTVEELSKSSKELNASTLQR